MCRKLSSYHFHLSFFITISILTLNVIVLLSPRTKIIPMMHSLNALEATMLMKFNALILTVQHLKIGKMLMDLFYKWEQLSY